MPEPPTTILVLTWISLLLGSFALFPGSSAVISSRGNDDVIKWNDAALQAVRHAKMGAPMTARALAIVHT
jgi:hypothetical protein